MPSVLPYPPLETKRLLEQAGYFVVHETEFNWFLMKEDHDAPVALPKGVALVPVQIANQVARLVGMATYIAWQYPSDQAEL